MMMLSSKSWLFFLGAMLLQPSEAIYKDDVGVLDFSVATAGHGPVEWASFHGDLLLTSAGDSCFVAARNVDDGSLAWRRNVCSIEGKKAVASSDDAVFTVDDSGIVRAWTMEGGDLLWDVKVENNHAPPSIFFDSGSLGVGAGNDILLLDPSTGATLDMTGIPETKDEHHLEWKGLYGNKAVMAVVHSESGMAPSDFFVGSFGASFKSLSGKFKAKNMIASSVVSNSLERYFALTGSGSVVSSAHGVISPKDFLPEWKTVVSVKPIGEDLLQVSGKTSKTAEATMQVFRYDGAWKPISDSGTNSAVAVAPKLGLVVTTPTDRSVEVHDLSSGKALKLEGDIFGSDGDSVAIVSVTEDSSGAKILIGTERGSTTMVSLAKSSGDSVELSVDWTAEEGLASLSSAIILDASHLGSDDLVEEQDSIAYKLSMGGRFKAQWQEIGALLSTANGLIGDKAYNYRDHLFGFLKVSALLSSETHRMWGMSTGGKDRGSIRWSVDLPKTAKWHSMVHGTTNAANLANGVHGDTHSREILVLSGSRNKIDWMCIDGTSGAINAQASVEISSPIQQVVPIYGSSTGGCRQASLLLGKDLSLTVVPTDAQTESLVQSQLEKTPNGFYTHRVDRDSSMVRSYRVSQGSDQSFAAVPVGMASFEGEEIVQVAYPMRHEDLQSMSTILGDNSLLLKYINPHMAVVVTKLSNEKAQSATEVATALDKEAAESKKRKPAGVGTPGSSTTNQQLSDEIPNMFVNLVDTVSGRVLYRHSHSNVDASKTISVVVSENWVVYSYVSAKTRRTEIGVLTLHEGMIEPKGLTYFARPEQSSTFSSFDSRESKPVVLSKVYAFPKAVTALGVTSTKQGISRQNILLASSDGSLSTINKMILETRRPVGEVKPNEKKEGLLPYKEMIPGSPLFSLNYNQTMEPFQSIVSTTTSLESQSLVFGFGGPDLFFTRTSPTKGFDLLPESFNKMLVGTTTVAIVVALLLVQRMGSKKTLKQGWS